MEELVRLKPDIIVSGTMAGVITAKKLTDTTRIVSEMLADPIEFGLAVSYARPGGNVTGVLLTVEDLPTKLLALALEVVPRANKIGLLVHSDNPIQPVFQRSVEVAANALGIELTVLEIVSPDDLHTAFQHLAHEHVKMVLTGFHVPQRTEANRVVRHGRAVADDVRVSRQCRRWWVDELRDGPA